MRRADMALTLGAPRFTAVNAEATQNGANLGKPAVNECECNAGAAMSRRLPITLFLAATAAGTAQAQSSASEPVSVGDRFNANNAAKGLQLGPWQVTPTATLRGGYDDNITTVPDTPTASTVIQLRGRLDVTNADGANFVTAYAEAGNTWYTEAQDLDHFDASGGAAFQSEIGSYVRLRGSLGVAIGNSEDSADEGVIVAANFDPYVDLAKYLQVPASLGISFDGGHYKFSAGADLLYSDYDPRLTQSGLTIAQGFRNGTNVDLKARAGYSFSPATTVFVEGGYNLQNYDDENANSTGWRGVAGAEFEFSRLLTGELFAGYAAQTYDNGQEVTGLTYGASLDWFATELISLKLAAKREFGAEQTEILLGTPITSAVTRDSASLGVEYEPLRQMLVRAEGGWRQTEYDGQIRTDTGLFAGVGLDYVMSANFRVNLDYKYDQTESEVAGDTQRNVFMLGLTTGY